MSQLNVIIEEAENNYSAYVEEVDGIAVTGSSVPEIKSKINEAIALYVETCRQCNIDVPENLTDYKLKFNMDVKTALHFYCIFFSMSGLSRLTGINQKQLWHYAAGQSKPREKQRAKILSAFQSLGTELQSITF